MPPGNKFRHQAYRSELPATPVRLLRPEIPPPVGSGEYRRRMREVGAAFRRAQVAILYLMHGTFAGTDAWGFICEVSRVWPAAAKWLGRLEKRAVDALLQDTANYSPDYAQEFEAAINAEQKPHIPVRLFYWSSQNCHVGRAHGAVQLIDELAALRAPAGGRVLLWGHSHAGNLLALATNLLGGDRATRARFFRAARTYYRWPLCRKVDLPVWPRVKSLLDTGGSPLSHLALDIVTFGAPVCYGWDSGGYARLLHFVHHRPASGIPSHLAVFPPKIRELLTAAHGDYVQQFGIAGTNLGPSIFGWRAWLAERRLNRLLQGNNLRRRDLLARLRVGARVHDEGETLLVDYGREEGHIGRHFAGHAVYTRLDWLLFHAEETALRLYNLEESPRTEDL